MDGDDDDGSPSAAEQGGFSEARKLIGHLVDVEGLPAAEVGIGMLIAAFSILRKAMPEADVAKLLYKYADDYATRHLER